MKRDKSIRFSRFFHQLNFDHRYIGNNDSFVTTHIFGKSSLIWVYSISTLRLQFVSTVMTMFFFVEVLHQIKKKENETNFFFFHSNLKRSICAFEIKTLLSWVMQRIIFILEDKQEGFFSMYYDVDFLSICLNQWKIFQVQPE